MFKNKNINKVKKIFLTFLMISSTLISNVSMVLAETYKPINLGTISGTGADVKLGYNTAFWRDGIGKIEVNSEIAFCIEPIDYFLLNINS